jgi:hypothetical protein
MALCALPATGISTQSNHFHFDATIIQQNCFMDARTEHDCQRCYGQKLYACMALLSPENYQQHLTSMSPEAYRSYMHNMDFATFAMHADRCADAQAQELVTSVYRDFYTLTTPKEEQCLQTLAGYKEHFLTYQADMKGKQIWIEQQFRCIQTSAAYMQLALPPLASTGAPA